MFARLIDACFARLGRTATVYPQTGEPFAVTVMTKAPDRIVPIEGVSIHAETIQFEVRRDEYLLPAEGDELEVDGARHVIQSPPTADRAASSAARAASSAASAAAAFLNAASMASADLVVWRVRLSVWSSSPSSTLTPVSRAWEMMTRSSISASSACWRSAASAGRRAAASWRARS